MSQDAKNESQAIRMAVVPEHRVIEAGLRAARGGLGTLAGGLAVYYAVIAVYRGLYSPDNIRTILVLGCASTAVVFAGTSAYLRKNHIALSSVWPFSVALISLIIANMGLYQILQPSPDALNNFGMLNVIVAVLAMNRRVVLTTLFLSTGTWAMATAFSPVPDFANDATYLFTTWVLAYGLHVAGMASLATNEALRLQVEMSLDASERRIDQRDRALATLKHSQYSLRRVVDKNPESVLMIQGDVVVYANRAFKRRVARTTEQVEGMAFRKLLVPEDQDLADTQLLLGDPAGVELSFAKNDGSPVPTEITAVQVSFDGNPAVMLVSKDLVTDQEANAERAALAQRMMAVGTLAAGVAHEINNPLAYVMSNLEMLQTKLRDNDLNRAEHQQLIDVAMEGATRVRDIVSDLRTFSRPDEATREPIDLHALLETSIRMAWNQIRHRATLVCEYQNTPAVAANPARLGQVFLNLLINAAQAIDEGDANGQHIWVRTGVHADQVFVEFRDTGCGMTEAVQQHIFEPFYTTKAIGMGTGLGLPFCQEVIDELGGALTVDSQPGEGALFRITLPATQTDPTPKPAPEQTAVPTEHVVRKILVVDDEEALAEAIGAVLCRDDVTLVSSGTQALKALTHQHFDIILCDIMMPEMSGPEVYEAIRKHHPAELRKLAFMTGGTFTDATRQFLDSISTPVLAKPFRAKALRAIVDQIVSD